MEYKIFIPCAGIGSRLKDLTLDKNKALVKVAGKEVIKHILDKFDESIQVVIALGYQGGNVRSFLEKEYPKRNFIFVNIDNFEGPGSGLGYSMSKCKEFLQCPFIFTSNDTIVLEDVCPPTKNYMGYAEKQDVSQFRNIELNGNKIIALQEKGSVDKAYPYIGLSGIYDYKKFWETYHIKRDDFLKIGESAGLKHMLSEGLHIEGVNFTWLDTGNLESLEKTKNKLEY